MKKLSHFIFAVGAKSCQQQVVVNMHVFRIFYKMKTLQTEYIVQYDWYIYQLHTSDDSLVGLINNGVA